RYRRCNVGRRLIFRDIARVETRHGNFLHARCLEGGHFRRPAQSPSLELEIALSNRMHRGTADGLGDGDGAEFHAASAFCRSTRVIGPMIATALSAGDTASMASPIGA